MIGGHYVINAFGSIEVGDDDRFLRFLFDSNAPYRSDVYISSKGGDVESAVNIGRIIRERGFSTSIGINMIDSESRNEFIVPRKVLYKECFSAATLVFLGGRLRYFQDDAKFGVHRFSFKNPTPDNIEHSQVLSSKIANYLHDMNISPKFLELSSSIPSKSIEIIDESMLNEIGIATGGASDVEWTLHGAGGGLYIRGERYTLYGHQKVILSYANGMGFAFVAVIESMSREDELLNFDLVEIVLNGEDIRIDISNRCRRYINGSYTLIDVVISNDEAKLIAYSNSFGVQVRFSTMSEVLLGISAMDTSSGRDKLVNFYETLCR